MDTGTSGLLIALGICIGVVILTIVLSKRGKRAKEKEKVEERTDILGVKRKIGDPTPSVSVVCPECEDELEVGDDVGKCGLCDALTCDGCLEDHIERKHPEIMTYGELDEQGRFKANEE